MASKATSKAGAKGPKATMVQDYLTMQGPGWQPYGINVRFTYPTNVRLDDEATDRAAEDMEREEAWTRALTRDPAAHSCRRFKFVEHNERGQLVDVVEWEWLRAGVLTR